MKKLEELSISPAPWDFQPNNPAGPTVTDKWNRYVCGSIDINKANARLIAAAPKLYDACYRIERWEDHAKAHNKAIEPWSDIMHDLHAALAEAAGESEADNGK